MAQTTVFVNDPNFLEVDRTPQILRQSNGRLADVESLGMLFPKHSLDLDTTEYNVCYHITKHWKGEQIFVKYGCLYQFGSALRAEAAHALNKQ